MSDKLKIDDMEFIKLGKSRIEKTFLPNQDIDTPGLLPTHYITEMTDIYIGSKKVKCPLCAMGHKPTKKVIK